MKTVAIIPSGGIGSRFDSPIPKQYVKVLGKELIVYTIEVFQDCDLIDEIIIPVSESYIDLIKQIKLEHSFSKISNIVLGGKERQDSVYNGLRSHNFEDEDLVVVHDAARPMLTKPLLEKAIQSAKEFDSVLVAIKARDTLLKVNEKISNYIDRSDVYYAQTPQIFRYSILSESFKIAIEKKFIATDESMLVKNAGYEVKIVEGEFQNFKITTKSDLNTFEKLIS